MMATAGAALGNVIIGTGSAFPRDLAGAEARELTNEEASALLLGPDWRLAFAERNWRPDHPRAAWGVERRQWLFDITAARGGSRAIITKEGARLGAGDLAVEAARRALAGAGLSGGDIDICIVTTSTPPRITSALAADVGKSLGVRGACFDLRAGGAGGVHAWIVGSKLCFHRNQTALVVAAETPSAYIHSRSPAMSLLCGDGAGALILTNDGSGEGGPICSIWRRRDAAGAPFTVPGPLPPEDGALRDGSYYFQESSGEYNKCLKAARVELARDLAIALRASRVGEIEYYISNAPTLDQQRAEARAAGVADAATVTTLPARGYLGCAGPLAALDELYARVERRKNVNIAATAVAGGILMAAVVWKSA